MYFNVKREHKFIVPLFEEYLLDINHETSSVLVEGVYYAYSAHISTSHTHYHLSD